MRIHPPQMATIIAALTFYRDAKVIPDDVRRLAARDWEEDMLRPHEVAQLLSDLIAEDRKGGRVHLVVDTGPPLPTAEIWEHPRGRQATDNEILAYHVAQGHEVEIVNGAVNYRDPKGVWGKGISRSRYLYAEGAVSYGGGELVSICS